MKRQSNLFTNSKHIFHNVAGNLIKSLEWNNAYINLSKIYYKYSMDSVLLYVLLNLPILLLRLGNNVLNLFPLC